MQGAISGAIGGFIIGTGFSLINGEGIGDALNQGRKSALQGAIINGASELYRGYLENRASLIQNQIKGSEGYKSFNEFKKVYGKAGEGHQWHHIVEQRPSNIEKFGPEKIHNIDNLVKLPKDIHSKISAYYSSKQPFSEHMTVRQWIGQFDYKTQYDFGLNVLKMYGY